MNELDKVKTCISESIEALRQESNLDKRIKKILQENWWNNDPINIIDYIRTCLQKLNNNYVVTYKLTLIPFTNKMFKSSLRLNFMLELNGLLSKKFKPVEYYTDGTYSEKLSQTLPADWLIDKRKLNNIFYTSIVKEGRYVKRSSEDDIRAMSSGYGEED